jgi:hypothetical protein
VKRLNGYQKNLKRVIKPEFYPKFGPAAMTNLVPGWQNIIIPEYHQALLQKSIDFKYLS